MDLWVLLLLLKMLFLFCCGGEEVQEDTDGGAKGVKETLWNVSEVCGYYPGYWISSLKQLDYVDPKTHERIHKWFFIWEDKTPLGIDTRTSPVASEWLPGTCHLQHIHNLCPHTPRHGTFS